MQAAVIDTVLEYWSVGTNRVCLCSPTGSGKTVVARKLAERMREDLGKASIGFCTDRIILLDQTNEKMQAAGLKTAIVQGSRTSSDAEIKAADVILFSWGTVQSRFLDPDEFNLLCLIMDEAHRDLQACRRWLRFDLPTLGLSATPLAAWMEDEYDVLEVPVTTVSCIDAGYLQAPLFRVDIPDPTKTEHGQSVGRAGEDWSAQESEQIMSPHNVAIAETWLKLCNLPEEDGGFAGRQPPTIVQASTKRHAHALADVFDSVSAGEWASLTDDNSFNESIEIIRRYKSGDLTGLVAVHRLSLGFDAPDTSIFVAARPTAKLVTWAQSVGRTMRLPDTERGELNPVVLDCAGNAHRFAGRLHQLWNAGVKWPLPKRSGGGGGTGRDESAPKFCPDHPTIAQSPSAQVCQVCYGPLREPEPVIEKMKFRADSVTAGDIARSLLFLAQRRCIEHGVDASRSWARSQMMMLTGFWPRNDWPVVTWTESDYGKPHPVVRRTVKENGRRYAAWMDQDENDRGPVPEPQRITIDETLF